jgi:hypothetical protein
VRGRVFFPPGHGCEFRRPNSIMVSWGHSRPILSLVSRNARRRIWFQDDLNLAKSLIRLCEPQSQATAPSDLNLGGVIGTALFAVDQQAVNLAFFRVQ